MALHTTLTSERAQPGRTIPETIRPVNQTTGQSALALFDCRLYYLQPASDYVWVRQAQEWVNMGWRSAKPRQQQVAAETPDLAHSREAAHYIGKMAAELRGLAIRAELHFLAYLLAMVEEDALSDKRDQSR